MYYTTKDAPWNVLEYTETSQVLYKQNSMQPSSVKSVMPNDKKRVCNEASTSIDKNACCSDISILKKIRDK